LRLEFADRVHVIPQPFDQGGLADLSRSEDHKRQTRKAHQKEILNSFYALADGAHKASQRPKDNVNDIGHGISQLLPYYATDKVAFNAKSGFATIITIHYFIRRWPAVRCRVSLKSTL